MKPYRIFIFLTMVLLQTGCVNAAITGAQMVYDRHSLQKSLQDKYITMQCYRALYMDTTEFKQTHITISTFNNTLVLTGQIPTRALRHRVEEIIHKIVDVDKMYDLTEIDEPIPESARMNDYWITAKINAKFITANEIDPNLFKVITENGNVYLMGIVPPEQAEVAVDLARNTAGVQNVIKIFSYLRITKK